MKYLTVISGICIIGLLQFTLLDHARVFCIKPDLLLAGMVLVSLYLKKWWGVSLSIFAGALKDIFSINALGINSALFFLWSLLLVKLSRKISIDNGFVFMATISIITALNSIIMRLIFLYLGKPISPGIFARIMILESVYTGLVSLLYFRAVKWLESK